MRRFSVLAALFVVIPAWAFAHVTVRPNQSKPGIEERYTVRVPTEGKVSTTSVVLEVPDGVAVTDVSQPEGATHDVKREGSRIVAITWTKEIKPGEVSQFLFVARNPATAGQITWKIQQRYVDGTSSNWTPGTKLAETAATPSQPMQMAQSGGAAAIDRWLTEYDAAFTAKDLTKLAVFYHPDVTIFEGGGVNNGWADYRDRHLGPELKEFQNLQFGHTNRKVHVVGDGRTAYVTGDYFIKAKMGARDIDSGGLETLVLTKGDDGAWKIRHSHTSSRARRPPQ